ncbi:MAG: DUF6502 family protein [Rhodospirillaceae bacterium]|nr:DUF6502 family protein [Rhodospirillaceae bacterium]
MADAHAPEPPKPLISAVQRLLKPLVRVLIAKGVGLPRLIELLKEIYVGVAEEEFPANGKKQTDSRISVLTGVHRKDVKRLRNIKNSDDPAPPRTIGLGPMVVARWVSSSATTDANGQPLPLPRQAESPGAPSFDALVASVSKDIRPRALLDEWVRLGVARLDAQGRVVLHRAAFVPEKGFDEKAFYLGRNIHDHLAAAGQNLLGTGNPLLERSVHYTGLSPESAKAVAEAAERLGMQSLLAVNRLALELAARDQGKSEASQRVNFGLYFYEAPSTLNGNHGDHSAK